VRSPLAWRRAGRADLPALRTFLEADEAARVGFSGRLLIEKPFSARELKLPSPLRGSVWISEAESLGTINGALLCHPSRLAFPVFPAYSAKQGRDLALLTSSFAPASALGLASDVERYEAALALSPRARVAYKLMSRPLPSHEAISRNAPIPAYPGLSIRPALFADLEALVILQEAYEREEVLTPIHSFNLAACRASLARALERQLVYVAEEGGVLVGKACTNARGFGSDQIGGVYTLPERRGRGVARSLVSALLYELAAAGRGSSLFVKPTNASARALYLGLGFEDVGDYRADYFEA
jgi:ribosomal protein S18 acetylase RimI-like enzyme